MSKKLVKIEASWCGPCKVLDRLLKQLYLPEGQIIKLDVESEEFEKSGFPKPRTIPTVHVVDENNEILQTISGMKDISVYREALK